jgi:predicted small lipoprotein YifL
MTGRLVALLGLALTLAACGPVTVFYRPDATVARLNTDRTECEVQALRDAPVANQVRQGAPYFVPRDRFCDSRGRCHIAGGYWVPGEIYTVDVNEDLRGRVYQQCMGTRGYTEVRLPRCPQSVARTVPVTSETTMPRITQQSCVIRTGSGTYQIVNAG